MQRTDALVRPQADLATTPRHTRSGSGSAGFFAMAIALALLTSAAEGGILVIKKYVLHHYVHLGVETVWMKPVANVALLLVLAAALSLVARVSPRWMTLPVGTCALVFLATLGVLLAFNALHMAAAAILAAGVAVQAARLVKSHPAAAERFIAVLAGWTALFSSVRPAEDRAAASPAPNGPSRRQVVVSTGLTLGGLCAGAEGLRWLAERRAIRALPPARAASAPNVLLIVLDTVRAQNTSLHDYPRRTTPALEQLAKKATMFEHAIATAPWTLPSHASMFTGRYPHELSVGWTAPLGAAHTTLAELLSANGYLTGGFIANTEYASRASGLARGFVHYEDFPRTPGQILDTSTIGARLADSHALRRLTGYYELPGRKTAADISRAALRWIESCKDRPFFAFLNYYDPHNPYLPPARERCRFGPDGGRNRDPWLLDRPEHHWSPEEVEHERNAYDSAIAYADFHVDNMLDELNRRGTLRNTLLIVTADHGEEFLEHGVMLHGSSLYLPSLNVPLLIAGPAMPAGRRVAAPVTLRDIPATVAHALGLDNPFPGTSLLRQADQLNTPAPTPLLSEVDYPGPCPAWFPVSRGDMKSLVSHGMHYIRNGDGSEELYDVRADPWERDNLIAAPGNRAVADRLRDELSAFVKPSAGAGGAAA